MSKLGEVLAAAELADRLGYKAHTPTKDALIADLVEALEDALEFMEGYEDVVDGSYGVPAPNKAMQVCTQIRSALARAKL